ncbi:MAG: translation initiation factor IF-2 [Verrucomicrobia bacterium]|nr:translation initiation factor IF-2 [Verrucomicrobiota bacterium]
MPVRIYDIAKKLGIESKAVLAKAKELGITGAKVPSSSLDKITAEFLENEMGGVPVAPVAVVPTPEIILVTPPPEPPETTLAPPIPAAAEPAVSTAPVAAPEIPIAPSEIVPALTESATTPLPPPLAPTLEVPPAPRPPQLGDKVGFIQLPQRPAPKIGDKIGSVKLPPRPVAPTRGSRMPPRPGLGGTPARTGSRSPERPEVPKAPAKPGGPTEPKFIPPTTGELISLKPPIIVRDLAEKLNRKPFQLIADLIHLNVFANVNQALDEVVAQKICAKYGFRFEVEKRERGGGIVHAPVKKIELDMDDKPEELVLRAPVVTIMGHVDHGKTTLLDVIRKANVAAGEAGGITQHIGAYTITIPHPERPKELQQITFLDTPGHAAFSAMRARGANVTDIVILVVAANDGVMPQTMEALNHARAAKVPIIVAVNKSDHPNANPMKVRQQLQDKGLVCEEWGGDTIFQDVSALTKQGVDKLLELIVLQAEIMELKANPNRRAKGNVIESGLEPGGPTATVLVRKGTLRVGETIICGHHWGKVRALINEEGKRLKEAGPSVAVKVLGLNGVPEAGLEFSVVENEKSVRELAEQREQETRALGKEKRVKVTLENLFDALAADSAKVLRVLVKADTQGSVEAIVEALKKTESDLVSLEVIHSAVGTITKEDVMLASASKGIILGFHTRIDNGVTDIAKREGVQIKQYTIIYELIDQVKEAMAGLLDPILKEVVIGSAEVRQIFALSKGGNVAGCIVNSGRIVKGKARILRRKEVIHEGIIQTLRRFQDDVNEVRAGLECGIRVSSYDDLLVGDVIESFTTEKVAQKL